MDANGGTQNGGQNLPRYSAQIPNKSVDRLGTNQNTKHQNLIGRLARGEDPLSGSFHKTPKSPRANTENVLIVRMEFFKSQNHLQKGTND